ncbi:MAG: hypothetical protein IKI01_03660 [Lachnospiraceae bacterium]|nr:hypothetical protein [Lachnospiraceae bacterium]
MEEDKDRTEEAGRKYFAIIAILICFFLVIFLMNPRMFSGSSKKDKEKKKDRFSLSPDDIELDTPEEIKECLEIRYGKVELLSAMETGTGDRRRMECTFRDVEHDFPFQAWSEPNTFLSLDGAHFGYKGAGIGDNYIESFTNWICIQLRPILEEHGIEWRDNIDKNDFSVLSIRRAYSFRDNVLVSPSDLWRDDKGFVLSTVRSFNLPWLLEGKLSDLCVIKSAASVKEPERPLTEEETVEKMLIFLRVVYKIEAEYIRREETTAGEVPGLLDQVFYEAEVTEEVTVDTPVYLYYFRYEDKEFFVCDIKVRTMSDDGYIRDIQYYQNYHTLRPDRDDPTLPGDDSDAGNGNAGGGGGGGGRSSGPNE